MAYTYDQLVLAYTAAHDGIGPDAATQATFQIQAVQSANGQLTDAQLLGNIVNGVDSTTTLAVLAYQFFTGKSPTKAGIDYLVNSSVNTADLNDPYYSKFSLENRYINFAANLGVQGEGASNFAAKYGALSFSDYVASIYQTIIGASYATASGIDPAKAIADIISRKDAILATATSAGMIPANATAAQIDIALKAATAGYLLGEAIKADVGIYAAAANNFMVAVVQGTAVYNTDITYTYQPAVNTPSHGTGHVLDNAPPVLPVPPPPNTGAPDVTPPVSHSFTLGAGVNNITATSGDDTFTATNATIHNGDTLNGGAGNDVLNITSTGALTVPSMNVSNIETVNLTSAGSLRWNNNPNWTGVQTVNATGVGVFDLEFVPAGIRGVNVNATINAQGTSNSTTTIYGGHNVTATINGGGTADSEITNVTGNINVTRTNIGAGAHGYVSAQGNGSSDGTTMVVTQISDLTGVANGSTQTNGDVGVTGGLHTTSVQIVNPTPVTAVAGVGGNAGIADGAADVIDWSTANGGALGTLTTASINGFSRYAQVQSNVLSNLTLTHGSGTLIINDGGHAVGQGATTLNLTINDLNINGNLQEESGNVSSSVYTVLNITNGPMDSHFSDIQMLGLTTLTVGGTGNLYLDSVNTNGSAPLLHTITITGTASLTAHFGTGNETITLGAGASNIDVSLGGTDHIIVTAANAASNTVFSSLTINPGDTLKINAQGGAAAFTGTMDALQVTGTTFQSYLDSAAAANNGGSGSHWSWFQYTDNNTYIVLESSTDGVFHPGTDIVVQIIGQWNEGNANITNGVLTLQ